MTASDSNKRPRLELYAPYYALWPLVAMNIVTDQADGSDIWADIAARLNKGEKFVPTRGAIIDTSVAVNHPNLEDVIEKVHVDFFLNPVGSVSIHQAFRAVSDTMAATSASRS